MPRMRLTRIFLIPLFVSLSLSACGSDPDSSDSDSSTGSTQEDSQEEGEQGRIVESGFGQSGQYAWVTAAVENLSDHGGQTVTVNFNVMDESGEVIGSQSQVESFNIAGQSIAVGTQVDLGPRVDAASVEATLLVEDDNTFEETDVDLGVVEADSIQVDQYDKKTWHAKFSIENPTDEPLQSPRIGVICKDATGEVIGGGSDYPELVPASGEVAIDPYLITSGKPTECAAYVAAGML